MAVKNLIPTSVVNSELSKLLQDKKLREKAILGLEDCLNATTQIKDADGNIKEYTDFRTILGAIQTILNYTDGRPVERREVITRKAVTLEDLQAKADGSPELRAAIEALLRPEKTIVGKSTTA